MNHSGGPATDTRPARAPSPRRSPVAGRVPSVLAQRLAGQDPAAAADAGRQLAAAITRDDWPASLAAPLASILVAVMEQASEPGQARIAVLLGILAERDPAAAGVILGGVDSYLRLLASACPGTPVYLSLLYLLAHLTEARGQIMAVAGRHRGQDPDGISRLERLLQPPDPADPETVTWAGRSWPSPAFLAITAGEVTATAAERAALPAAQILASWEADTVSMLAYSGALAVTAGA